MIYAYIICRYYNVRASVGKKNTGKRKKKNKAKQKTSSEPPIIIVYTRDIWQIINHYGRLMTARQCYGRDGIPCARTNVTSARTGV